MRHRLNDRERALAKRRPNKTVFVALVMFRGPRGRNYTPIRTAACLTADLARDAAQDIRNARYAHGAYPTSTWIHEVDFIGRVQNEERA